MVSIAARSSRRKPGWKLAVQSPGNKLVAIGKSTHRRNFGWRIFPMKWFRPWWLLILIPISLGLARLHFDVEVLDLLPANVHAVQGLKIYQQHFANARELIVTVKAPNSEIAEATAKSIAEKLRAE